MQQDFSRLMERYRKSQKLSYRAFSERLFEMTDVSIDASGLQRIEAGTREPRLSEAIAIAQALGTDLGLMIESDQARSREILGQIVIGLQSVVESIDSLRYSQEDVAGILESINDPEFKESIVNALEIDNFFDVAARLFEIEQTASSILSKVRHPSRAGITWAKPYETGSYEPAP